MKKVYLGALSAAALLLIAPNADAAPHRKHKHHRNEGLELAAGIVHLVKEVIAPTPVVVTPPPPPPAPVVVAPAPVVVTPPPPPPPPRPVVVVTPPPAPRPVVVTPPPRVHHRPAPPPRQHHPAPRHDRGRR